MDRITEKDLTPQMRREMDRLQMEWYYLGLQLQELVDFEMRKKIKMKERPILFKPEMVNAILNGVKTQTRRVVKDQALPDFIPMLFNEHAWDNCPYGVVGNILWVRETWSCAEKKFRPGGSIVYKADGALPLPDHTGRARWRPSIFMPRAACRLRLEIVDVHVERLHDISEEDARAEGVDLTGLGLTRYRQAFFWLWRSINGKESLDANPWVWVIKFRKKN